MKALAILLAFKNRRDNMRTVEAIVKELKSKVWSKEDYDMKSKELMQAVKDRNAGIEPKAPEKPKAKKKSKGGKSDE